METVAHMDKSLAIDLAEADFPLIRVFVVTSPPAVEPQAQVEGVWVVCTPETVKRFSAVAYHFGRALHQELKQPVGMIVAAQGSMSIQAFISLEAQERAPELKPMFESSAEVISKYDQDAERKNYERELAKRDEVARKAADEGKRIWGPPVPRIHPRQHMSYPANIFNGRISPLIPFIKNNFREILIIV